MAMFYLYIKYAVIGLVLLTAATVIIRAQPHDDHDLRAFLMPPGDCSAPCFMGIRPGETRTSEAPALLQAHPWVGTVVVYMQKLPAIYGSNPGITWTWSGQQPQWIDASQEGSLTFEDDVVGNIRFQSTIQLGEVRLMLGEPDSQRTSNTQSPAGRRFRSYAAIYPQNRLWISIGALCPVKQPFDAFRQPVFLQWFHNSRASLNPSSAWSEVYRNC